jgi:hypothetical protein
MTVKIFVKRFTDAKVCARAGRQSVLLQPDLMDVPISSLIDHTWRRRGINACDVSDQIAGSRRTD